MKDTRVEMVLANELLPERCEIYRHFYKDVEMIQGDINAKADEIIARGKGLGVDFVMATPPCQSFSAAGKKAVADKRTPLFLSVIAVVRGLAPKYVLMENVPSFMASVYEEKNDETIAARFARELPGYHIETHILNAKDYEVPQSRKRSIVLFSRRDMPKWMPPKKIGRIITVRQTIGHLPPLESGQAAPPGLPRHKARVHNPNHILWMSHTPTGKTAFDNPVHFPQKGGRKIKGYRTTYKRIEWDSPAPTITMSSGSISSQNNVHPGTAYMAVQAMPSSELAVANPSGDVVNPSNVEHGNILYDNARALTVYEIMLLTGLDAAWNPPTDNEHLLRDIIGEAVPPRLVYHILGALPVW
jgi:DNA (cytosine-5)-methyltransferase 1